MSHYAAPLLKLQPVIFKNSSLRRLLLVGVAIFMGASAALETDWVGAEETTTGQKDRPGGTASSWTTED